MWGTCAEEMSNFQLRQALYQKVRVRPCRALLTQSAGHCAGIAI